MRPETCGTHRSQTPNRLERVKDEQRVIFINKMRLLDVIEVVPSFGWVGKKLVKMFGGKMRKLGKLGET